MAKSESKSLQINRHKGKCKVCNSGLRQEIEERYSDWESPYDLEEDKVIEAKGITASNIYTHITFFGLDLKRDEDHDKLLRRYIDKGFRRGLKITEGSLLKAVEMRMKKRGELTDGQTFMFLTDAELIAKLGNLNGVNPINGADSQSNATPKGGSGQDSD